MVCAVCCVLSRVCVACQTDRGAQRKTGTPLAKMLTGRVPMPGKGAGSRGRRTRVAATALHTDWRIRVHKQRRLKTATTIIKLNCCLM